MLIRQIEFPTLLLCNFNHIYVLVEVIHNTYMKTATPCNLLFQHLNVVLSEKARMVEGL